jgi:hypothetical protein
MKQFKNREFYYPVFLILAVLAVYFPILGNDFLYFWDDQWVAINHYTEGGFTGANLWAIFSRFYHGQYSPLNELLYLTLHTLFGYNPVAFHAASLLLHGANVCLVYVCIRQLLIIKGKTSTRRMDSVAFLTALIFAVHPFNVESVAWISASKVLVYSLYYLIATLMFLLYLKQGKIKYYVLTVAFFACSFLGKEQAVTFPLWMLLIYWISGCGFKDKKVWLTTAPLLVLSLLFGLITIVSQTGGGLTGSDGYPVWQRMAYACYTLTEYLVKTVAPFKLLYIYPFPSQPGDPLPSWLLVYPALFVVLLLSFGNWIYSRKLLFFSLLFFLIHIALALHIISISRFAVVADRYVYLASIGMIFPTAYYSVKYIRIKRFAKILITCMIAYLIYFGAYANVRSRVWHDTDTLKKEIRDLLKDRDDYQTTINLIPMRNPDFVNATPKMKIRNHLAGNHLITGERPEIN